MWSDRRIHATAAINGTGAPDWCKAGDAATACPTDADANATDEGAPQKLGRPDHSPDWSLRSTDDGDTLHLIHNWLRPTPPRDPCSPGASRP